MAVVGLGLVMRRPRRGRVLRKARGIQGDDDRGDATGTERGERSNPCPVNGRRDDHGSRAPAEAAEAWCHQRGYVCFIEELHRKKVKAGETFGAAYAVGWFDDVADMEKTYDKFKGKRTLTVEDGKFRLE